MLRKLPLVPTIIILVAFVILFRLGWWQLERSEEKRLLLLEVQQQSQQRMSFEQALRAYDFVSGTPVQLSGKLELEKVFYWDNRIVDGRVGYEVLVPVYTNKGTVVVNVGWIASLNTREQLPEIVLPNSFQQVDAQLWLPGDNVFIKETLAVDSPWPKRIQHPTLSVMEEHFQQALLPVMVSLEEGLKGTTVPNVKVVVMPPEKHIGYAIQWFGLAIAVLIVYGFALRKKYRDESEK